jgi:hypothetical protein
MTIGLAIMAFDRPHYLKRTLDALAANDLRDIEVHVWQDAPTTPGTVKGVEGSIAAWVDAGLPGTLHTNEVNLCCAAQRYQIMPYMAERYERFICMDDDLLLSPWALRHMRTLFDQYADDPRFATISPGFVLLCAEHDLDAYRDRVWPGSGHFWCEGWWRDKWERVWPWYEAYFEIARNWDYRLIHEHRDEMAAWAVSMGSDVLGVSSDVALWRGIKGEGMKRLRMVVNRAYGIGVWGLHCRPDVVAGLGLADRFYAWPDESDIARFELVPELPPESEWGQA